MDELTALRASGREMQESRHRKVNETLGLRRATKLSSVVYALAGGSGALAGGVKSPDSCVRSRSTLDPCCGAVICRSSMSLERRCRRSRRRLLVRQCANSGKNSSVANEDGVSRCEEALVESEIQTGGTRIEETKTNGWHLSSASSILWRLEELVGRH